MPPKKTAAAEDDGSVVTFTESEVKFIKAVFDNFKSRPDVDFDKVADVLGLANAKSARDRFRVISKKHGWGSTDGSAGASTSSAKGKGKGALAAKNNSKVTKKAATKKKGTAQKKKVCKFMSLVIPALYVAVMVTN